MRDGLAAGAHDLQRHPRGALLIEVGGVHLGAQAGQQQRGGAPDARAGAGHDRHLAREIALFGTHAWNVHLGAKFGVPVKGCAPMFRGVQRARLRFMPNASIPQGQTQGHFVGPTAMSSVGDLAPAAALPSVDLGALARRAALPAALAAVAAAVVLVAGGPLQAFADAIGRALDADPVWVVGAAAFELLSFVGYVALLWLVGGRATPRLGPRASAHVTLGGAAATRLLPTGGGGGAVLTFWAFRRAGLDSRQATRTMLTFLVLLYAVFLGSIMVAGGLLALGLVPGGGPLALSAVPAVAARAGHRGSARPRRSPHLGGRAGRRRRPGRFVARPRARRAAQRPRHTRRRCA